MKIRTVLKRVILGVLIANIIFVLALGALIISIINSPYEGGTPTNYESEVAVGPAMDTTISDREAVFRNLVQTTADRYGAIGDPGSAKYDPTDMYGLWDAQSMDLNYDGEDELFLTYMDDNNISSEIYEYIDGEAVKKWSFSSALIAQYNVIVYESDDGAFYWYYDGDGEVGLCSYIDGAYVDASDMGDITDEEFRYYGEGETAFRSIMKNRLEIYADEDEETVLLSLSSRDNMSTDIDALTKRWGITITGHKVPPLAALGNVYYYGDMTKCKMPGDMALAYAQAIESEIKDISVNSDDIEVKANLVDVAGDGMPILLTATVNTSYGVDGLVYADEKMKFHVWTWDGKEAKKYDFENDAEFSITGFGFLSDEKEADIVLIEDNGWGRDRDYCEGRVIYKVSDAQITKLGSYVSYSAYSEDGETVYGDIMPGVSIKSDSDGRDYTTVDEILKAGWVCTYEGSSYSSYICNYLDGEMTDLLDYEELDNLGYAGGSMSIIHTPEVGPTCLTNEWNYGATVAESLTNYAEVIGRPRYTYEEVLNIFTDEQVKKIAEKIADITDGEIGEIYKLSDDLYLVVIYVDGSATNTVVIKHTKNGSDWRIVKFYDGIASEDDISDEINNDSQAANISIDLNRANEGTEYLDSVLCDIDGSVPNDAAKNEIIKYIEISVSQAARINVKTENGVIIISKDDIKDAAGNAGRLKAEYDKLLENYGITLDKPVVIVIFIVVENADITEGIQVTFDEEIVNMLSDDNELMLVLGNSDCSIKVSKADLLAIIESRGKLTVTFKQTDENVYMIQFADKDGNMIDKLGYLVTFTVPADNNLCTISAEYTGGTDNWGGLASDSTGTISFATAYSGTYTVLNEQIDISDIDGLSEEHKKAITYMVSKGFFTLDNGNFYPDDALNRYAFAEAIVGMFFEFDPDATTTFSDVTPDNPYYKYVASAQKIDVIEGYDDNTFGGLNEITKEQALALCSRTLRNRMGYTLPDAPFDYLHFIDNDMISSWATEDVSLTVREALIEDGGMLYPKDSISRADAALLLYRLFNLIHKVEPVELIVNAGAMPESVPKAAEAAASETSIWVWIILAAIIVLIIVIVILLIMLFRKPKSDVAISDVAEAKATDTDKSVSEENSGTKEE